MSHPNESSARCKTGREHSHSSAPGRSRPAALGVDGRIASAAPPRAYAVRTTPAWPRRSGGLGCQYSFGMREAAVEVRDVVVRYGDVVAVDGVSLTVPRGRILALLGNNGAGKTSLLQVCEGFRGPGQSFEAEPWSLYSHPRSLVLDMPS